MIVHIRTEFKTPDNVLNPEPLFMTTLTKNQLAEYVADPLGTDFKVRQWAGVPEDRYFTVSVWPEQLAGRVFVRMTEYRKVAAKKISKSDQS